jgi:D-glycero-D-manno-heptose 1,7-bisphosphate phosphatase
MQPGALFLDRDGTINTEVDFLSSPSGLRLLPRSADAIRRANTLGFRVIVISNQSGVARGLVTEEQLAAIHAELRQQLSASGASVDAIYYCPHHPEIGEGPYRSDCDCRKPKPGMLVRAAREFGIELQRSYVVGDRMIDLQAAQSVGATAILVRTGYGEQELELCRREHVTPDIVAGDLFAAVEQIERLVHNPVRPVS